MQHGFFGSTSAAAGAVLATNKVSTRTAASITNQSATAGGALAVTASDAATIASNVKVVSNSVTTTDSGLHFLGKFVDGSVPATYTTASGSRTVAFGTTVRVLHGYATPRFTTDDPTTVALKTGDRIRVRDGYAGGGDPGVYRYLGPDASLKPSTQDYSDAATWVLVAGADDVVYRYMGGTPVTLDLGATTTPTCASGSPSRRPRSCRSTSTSTRRTRARSPARSSSTTSTAAPPRGSTA